MSFSLGVMISKNNNWSVALDFASSQWSGYSSSLDSTMNSGINTQSYKMSLGGEYTPDANNIRNYFSRVTYRYGLYYGADYIKIQNTQIPCYGVTLGASLPVRRSFSHVHMALDLGRLGTTTNSLLQETYVRFSLGVSLNNQWFVKRRYD